MRVYDPPDVLAEALTAVSQQHSDAARGSPNVRVYRMLVPYLTQQPYAGTVPHPAATNTVLRSYCCGANEQRTPLLTHSAAHGSKVRHEQTIPLSRTNTH